MRTLSVALLAAVTLHVFAVAALLIAVAAGGPLRLLVALAGLVFASIVWVIATRSFTEEERAVVHADVHELPQRFAA